MGTQAAPFWSSSHTAHRQLLTSSDQNFSSRPHREQELSQRKLILGPAHRICRLGDRGLPAPRDTRLRRQSGCQELCGRAQSVLAALAAVPMWLSVSFPPKR